jgi:zinc transporter
MIAATQYGSDHAGLVWAWVFEPGLPACVLDATGAEDHLAKVTRSGAGFLWLHFNLSNTAAERWMRRHACLPEVFFSALHEGSHPTRVETDDKVLIAVLNDVRFKFSFDPSEVATLWLCVSPGLVVTARGSPLRSVDRLRESVKAGLRPGSPAALFAHLLRNQSEVLAEVLHDASGTVDRIEDRLLDRQIRTTRAELGSLRRTLVRLQRLLAPEPSALFRLLGRPPAWIVDADVQELRQAAEEVSATVADSVGLVERVKLLQEELTSLVEEQNNRSLFVLTIVTVLALPINIIAGLLGMNVGGVPLAQNEHGFWVVVTLVLVVTGGAAVWAFRRNES